jgi:hypothetical protein
MTTERDEFVRSEVQAMLAPGEQVRNVAYILRAPGLMMQILYMMVCFWLYFFQVKHYYGALTDRRLILLRTRSGIFRPKIANEGFEEIDLAQVQSVTFGGFANNRSITLHKRDGGKESLRIAPWAKLCSGQSRFMDDLQQAVGALPAQATGAVA